MLSSSEITDLLRRFVDDRDGLQEHEYAQLVEAVKQSPELASQLRDQLVMDEVLSQRLAIDRQRFDAQVQQRIADHLRGEDELNDQADELHSLALARLAGATAEPKGSWSTLVAWGTALVLLLGIGLGVWSWREAQHAALVATVAEVSGQVIVQRFPKGSDLEATSGQMLQTGDRLALAEDALLALTWQDGTRVQLSGGTEIRLPETNAGKRIEIKVGDLTASVAKQPSGRPMVFGTPHADAIVRGTELSLHVWGNDTRLDVAEGKVELIEHETRNSQLVESSESATASQLANNSIRWPTSEQGIVYLFSAGRPTALLRSGTQLRPSRLQPQGSGIEQNDRGEWQLSGGWLTDDAAGTAIADQVRATKAMSLEIVFASTAQAEDQPRPIVTFAAGDAPWSLQQAGHQVQLRIGDEEPIELTALSELDKLTHLALIYGSERLIIYVDGQQVQELPLRTFLPAGKPGLIFGGAEPESRWHGRVAGLAIYDRQLTAAEIDRNFAGIAQE